MNANSSQTWVILLAIVAAVVAVAWLIVRDQKRRRSNRLRTHFGPEYGRVVAEKGDRAKAESELMARQKRVEKLKIVPLSAAEASRFRVAWDALQARFVDNPKGVVVEADVLVRDLMMKRGYPSGVFERRAADISVDHPKVVETYRSARAIAVRDQQGEASTEELRKAVVYYRALFDELLEVSATTHAATAPAPAEKKEVMHS
jgi:hypothetical protein